MKQPLGNATVPRGKDPFLLRRSDSASVSRPSSETNQLRPSTIQNPSPRITGLSHQFRWFVWAAGIEPGLKLLELQCDHRAKSAH